MSCASRNISGWSQQQLQQSSKTSRLSIQKSSISKMPQSLSIGSSAMAQSARLQVRGISDVCIHCEPPSNDFRPPHLRTSASAPLQLCTSSPLQPAPGPCNTSASPAPAPQPLLCTSSPLNHIYTSAPAPQHLNICTSSA